MNLSMSWLVLLSLVVLASGARSDSCTSAAPFFNPELAECVAQCPPGRAPDQDKECADCPPATPFIDHTAAECVAQCPIGQVPNDDNDCQVCDGDLPYVDSAGRSCVSECSAGEAPNEHSTCQACVPPTKYSVPGEHVCVAECPAGSVPNDQTAQCDVCKGTSTPLVDPTGTRCVASCSAGLGVWMSEAPGPAESVRCAQCDANVPARSHADHITHNCSSQCKGATIAVPIYEEDATETLDNESVDFDLKESINITSNGTNATSPRILSWNCVPCPSETPYALHEENRCVSRCPGNISEIPPWGMPPNELGECTNCTGKKPFLDHRELRCVSTCDTGYAVNSKASRRRAQPAVDGTCESCDLLLRRRTAFANHETNTCEPSCFEGMVSISDKNECFRCSGDEPYVKLVGRRRRYHRDKSCRRRVNRCAKCVARCPKGFGPNSNGDCHECTLARRRSSGEPFVDLETGRCTHECTKGTVPDPVVNLAEYFKEGDDDERAIKEARPGLGKRGVNCVACPQTAPYAEAYDGGVPFSKQCVSQCGPGAAPNKFNDCYDCPPEAPYADKLMYGMHRCVSECPDTSSPNPRRDCVKNTQLLEQLDSAQDIIEQY